MAYYGTNAIIASAQFRADGAVSNNFSLQQSFGCSSVTKVQNGVYRLTFSSTLANDNYVAAGSMSTENSSSGDRPVRGANGMDLLVHGTSSCDVRFAYGSYNVDNGNLNHGEHHGVLILGNAST